MTFREIDKIVRKDGWQLVSIVGSHHHYRHPNKKGKLTIPKHSGDIKPGTLNNILKQAGLK